MSCTDRCRTKYEGFDAVGQREAEADDGADSEDRADAGPDTDAARGTDTRADAGAPAQKNAARKKRPRWKESLEREVREFAMRLKGLFPAQLANRERARTFKNYFSVPGEVCRRERRLAAPERRNHRGPAYGQ